MKCQQCEKQAVFHITELETGEVREVHLCEDHARAYLNQSGAAEGGEGTSQPTGGALSVGQTADDLATLDRKACPMCGITFFEFRNQGRLGCAHDYVHFEKELEPLISNIHGSTQHAGRTPVREADAAGGALPAATDQFTAVIGLRREMQDAIACEDYEGAREHRDAIRGVEEHWLGGNVRGASQPRRDGARDET